LPKDIVFRNNREVRILALISEVNYRSTQRGQMASLIIEDGVKQINAVLFSQALGANSDQLILDEVVVISGKVNKDFRDQWQVVIDHIEPVEKVQVKYAKYLKLSLSKNNKLEYVEICQLLKEFHGKCPVMIEYHSNNASGNIPLKSEYDVSLQRDLLDALDKNLGQGKYKIQY
jgi:DNA polymerase-3 subunit alpha